MQEFSNKKKLKKGRVFIVIVILIIIIATIIFSVTRTTDNQEIANNIEANAIETTNTFENQLVAEAIQTEPERPKFEWQHDSPENHNLSESAISSVHSTIDEYPINAEVIVKEGVIVDEYYKDGYNSNSVFTMQSTSKSITSAIVGIVIDKGYISGVDVPISNYFPEILESDSEYLKEVTIRHLLTHTAGFSANDTNNWSDWRSSKNWVDYVLNSPIVSRPGTTFNYFTGNTHLLSAIIQKATGKTTYEFGKEYLFDPLGMDSVTCSTDAQGISDGGNGFALNPYDMAKFGQLFLNNGVWDGEQIISEQWVKDSTSMQFNRSSGSADYGCQWWVRTFGDNAHPGYFAQGHYGQYIFVVPDLNLVVAITSHYEGSSSVYWQMMNTIVNGCEL